MGRNFHLLLFSCAIYKAFNPSQWDEVAKVGKGARHEEIRWETERERKREKDLSKPFQCSPPSPSWPGENQSHTEPARHLGFAAWLNKFTGPPAWAVRFSKNLWLLSSWEGEVVRATSLTAGKIVFRSLTTLNSYSTGRITASKAKNCVVNLNI